MAEKPVTQGILNFFLNMTIYKYQKIRNAKRNSTQQTGCKNIKKHVIWDR